MALAKNILARRLARLDAHARALFGDSSAVTGLAVRSLRRRWGSCSVRGQITLAAQLIELPLPLIDYVIAHELCHLRHMDHSPAFHRALLRLLPDAGAREKNIRIWSLEHPRT
jgi:predicted metal-dependent hydrolase